MIETETFLNIGLGWNQDLSGHPSLQMNKQFPKHILKQAFCISEPFVCDTAHCLQCCGDENADCGDPHACLPNQCEDLYVLNSQYRCGMLYFFPND